MERRFTKVVGVEKQNPDGSNRQRILKRCRAGEELSLVRDPHNEYDENAIKVCREDGQQLGFIGRDIAWDFATGLDQGLCKIKAKIADLTGGGFLSGKSRGCNIEIFLELIPQEEQTEPICPYCGFRLEKAPGRKKKCPSCKKDIFVRGNPNTGQKTLVREDKVAEIERKYSALRSLVYWSGQ